MGCSLSGLTGWKPTRTRKGTSQRPLPTVLKQEGNFQEALQISIEKNAFIERYNEELLAEQLSDLTIQYEVKQKDLSIANLKEKNEAQTTILQQRNIIIGGVLVLLILGGLIGFQILRKRKMTHQFKITNLEQRLLRSQLNPHFLFNALNKGIFSKLLNVPRHSDLDA